MHGVLRHVMRAGNADEPRQEFIDSYRQIESLYEILSPSPEQREHIETFRHLADLYLMVRNAYGSPTRFYEDVARKTEQMVREMAGTYAPVATGKVVEFDLKTLQALRAEGDNNAAVINLVRAIETEAEEKAVHDRLEKDMEKLRSRGVRDVRFTVLSGLVVEALLDHVQAHPPELLIMGSRGQSTTRRLLLGSVSDALVHYANCPVLVAKLPPNPAPTKG